MVEQMSELRDLLTRMERFDDNKIYYSSPGEVHVTRSSTILGEVRSGQGNLQFLFFGSNATSFNKPQQDRLCIVLNGAMKPGCPRPFFQRSSWHADFPGSVLYISDPSTTTFPNLNLAWYIGSRNFDATKSILRLVLSIAQSLGLSSDKLVYYGSSGGGSRPYS